MQKHEKAALAAIKEVLEPHGWAIRTEYSGKSKLRVWADHTTLRQTFTISSSPSSREAVLFEARRWARNLEKRRLSL